MISTIAYQAATAIAACIVFGGFLVILVIGLSKNRPWKRCSRCDLYYDEDGVVTSETPSTRIPIEPGVCPLCECQLPVEPDHD